MAGNEKIDRDLENFGFRVSELRGLSYMYLRYSRNPGNH
jgi:hypothetical protein